MKQNVFHYERLFASIPNGLPFVSITQDIHLLVYKNTIKFVIDFEQNRIPLVIYRPSIHTIDPLIIRDREYCFKELPENQIIFKPTVAFDRNQMK